MDVPPVHYVLYLSRLLSAWGDRLWSFLSALFMLVLQVQRGPQSHRGSKGRKGQSNNRKENYEEGFEVDKFLFGSLAAYAWWLFMDWLGEGSPHISSSNYTSPHLTSPHLTSPHSPPAP